MRKKSEKKLSRRELFKIGGLGAAAFAATKVATESRPQKRREPGEGWQWL